MQKNYGIFVKMLEVRSFCRKSLKREKVKLPYKAKENEKNDHLQKRSRFAILRGKDWMKTGLNTKEDLPMEKQVGLTGQEVEERIRSGQVNRMENHMVKTNKEIVKAHLLTYFNFLNLFLAILVLITGQFKNMTFYGSRDRQCGNRDRAGTES